MLCFLATIFQNESFVVYIAPATDRLLMLPTYQKKIIGLHDQHHEAKLVTG